MHHAPWSPWYHRLPTRSYYGGGVDPRTKIWFLVLWCKCTWFRSSPSAKHSLVHQSSRRFWFLCVNTNWFSRENLCSTGNLSHNLITNQSLTDLSITDPHFTIPYLSNTLLSLCLSLSNTSVCRLLLCWLKEMLFSVSMLILPVTS